MEPELAIYCNQAKLPMEGLGHRPIHKTLGPQFVLPSRCGRLTDGTEFEEKANWCLAQFETHAMRGSPAPTLLMIFCYTCSQHTGHQRGFIQQLMETEAESQSQTVSRAWRILWKRGGKTEGARGVKDTTRKPMESTNLSPYGFRDWTANQKACMELN